VTGIVGLMAMTVWISTAAAGPGNGTRAHVTQLGDLHLNGGAAIFKINQGVGHLSLLNQAYHYARFYAAKKETRGILTFTSRTHTMDYETMPAIYDEFLGQGIIGLQGGSRLPSWRSANPKQVFYFDYRQRHFHALRRPDSV
jgi:hypothetical protein